MTEWVEIDADLLARAAALLAAARACGETVATAESCTGGLLAAALTAIPGSSEVFERGFVTYSNSAKSEMLGVPFWLIERHGAVSEDVARAMAGGVLTHSHASLAVAVTGIAGPDGGTPEKPVGPRLFRGRPARRANAQRVRPVRRSRARRDQAAKRRARAFAASLIVVKRAPAHSVDKPRRHGPRTRSCISRPPWRRALPPAARTGASGSRRRYRTSISQALSPVGLNVPAVLEKGERPVEIFDENGAGGAVEMHAGGEALVDHPVAHRHGGDQHLLAVPPLAVLDRRAPRRAAGISDSPRRAPPARTSRRPNGRQGAWSRRHA